MKKSLFDVGNDQLLVPLTCENHPEKMWLCRKISLSLSLPDGLYRYNHTRAFFYEGPGPECDCPSEKLYALIEDDRSNKS